MSVLADLRKKAVSGTATTTKAKPVIQLNDEQIAAARQFRESTLAIKSHEALVEQAKMVLDDVALQAILEMSEAQGKALSSVELSAGLVKLTYTVKSQYCEIKGEGEGDILVKQEYLQELFGERAQQYFICKDELVIRPECLNDECIATIMELLGKEAFHTIFMVKSTLKVSESFHTDYMTNPELRHKAADVPLIKRYAGSIRVS